MGQESLASWQIDVDYAVSPFTIYLSKLWSLQSRYSSGDLVIATLPVIFQIMEKGKVIECKVRRSCDTLIFKSFVLKIMGH